MQTVQSKVNGLDLVSVMAKVTADKGWSPAKARAAETAYREFLLAAAESPDDADVLDADVDAVWHVHILDTRCYAADCLNLFGRFLHHIPAAVTCTRSARTCTRQHATCTRSARTCTRQMAM